MNICFNSDDRWREDGIHFGQPIADGAEEKVAYVAAATARMLRRAYTKNTRPAQELDTMRNRCINEQELVRQELVAYG